MEPLSYFSFYPVLYGWGNKGHGTCYPVCRMAHIPDALQLTGMSSHDVAAVDFFFRYLSGLLPHV